MKSTAKQLHAPSFWSLHTNSVPDPQMVQHMFNCILLPSSHTGSCPLRGSRSLYTPTTDRTNVAIFISAEGNHCKGIDPAENRALIAVSLKPNVIATDKPHFKVHNVSPVYNGARGHEDYEHNVTLGACLLAVHKNTCISQ